MDFNSYCQQKMNALGYTQMAHQGQAVRALDALAQRIARFESDRTKRGLWLANWFSRSDTLSAAAGVYLWGGVGQGKTWLMDCFYEYMPNMGKNRFHFNRLMLLIHKQLQQLRGTPDPMPKLAAELADLSPLICIDEFYVTDITDAMILYALLDALFDKGCYLVATSNVHPDVLYRAGLQRQRFLPAIELIKNRMQLVEISGGEDFRLGGNAHEQYYYLQAADAEDSEIKSVFAEMAKGKIQDNIKIQVNARDIPVRQMSENIIWFEFDALCAGPRATIDYVNIAERFPRVIVSRVPVMGEGQDDKARRFISLVDVFYDRKIQLVLAAAELPFRLYQGKRFSFEFARTASRLEEMRSLEYVQKFSRLKVS